MKTTLNAASNKQVFFCTGNNKQGGKDPTSDRKLKLCISRDFLQTYPAIEPSQIQSDQVQ
jgi:hypothetical protein